MSLQTRLSALITAVGTDIKALNTALAGKQTIVPVVTAIPAGMTAADHNREIYLLVDEAGNYGGPYIWHCKYRHYKADGVTLNPKTYKWQVLSARPLHHGPLGNDPTGAVASDQTSSQVFTDLGVVGPSVTVPFAGDYVVEIACGANGAANPIMSFAVGATAAAMVDSFWIAGSSSWNTGSRKVDKTLAQGTALVSKYRTWTGVTVSFSYRTMFVTPERIG
jgi:hypothetical protein